MSRLRYIVLFICCLCAVECFAQPADTFRLPPQLAARAAALQKENDLAEWLYLQMDYAAELPAERLSFLTNLAKRAWRLPQNEAEHSAWLDMLTYQGYYQMFTGNILPSIAAYENAYRYYNEHHITETDILEYILKPLGNNYTRLGDYERAGFIQERGLDIAKKQDDPQQVAAAYSNLAVTCLMQDRLDLARDHVRNGLRAAPEGSSIAGLLHSSMAEIYIGKGMADSAAIHASQGMRILQRPEILRTENAGYWLASVLQANGDIAMLGKRYSDAEIWDARSLAVLDKFYPHARNREKARVLVKQGKAALMRHANAKQPEVPLQHTATRQTNVPLQLAAIQQGNSATQHATAQQGSAKLRQTNASQTGKGPKPMTAQQANALLQPSGRALPQHTAAQQEDAKPGQTTTSQAAGAGPKHMTTPQTNALLQPSHRTLPQHITAQQGDAQLRETMASQAGKGPKHMTAQQANALLQPFDRALRYMLPGHVAGWPERERLYGDFTIADAIEGRADALMRAGRLKEALEGYLLIFDIEAKLRREFFSRATRLLHQRQSHALAEKAMNAAYLLWERRGEKEFAQAMLLIMEKSKAQVLLQEQMFNMQQGRLGMKDSLLDEQQRLQQALAYYDREAAVSGKKNASREALAYELSQLQAQIRKKYPGYFSPVQQTSLHPEKDIPAGLTVKSLFSGEDHLYVMDVTNKGIQSIRRLDDGSGKQRFLQHFVTTYFHNGPAAMQNAPSAYYADAYTIFAWLWNDTIAPRYLLVPDGWFGYLPFDALVTDSAYKRNTAQWPFLLKQTVTSLAYSLQTYRQQSPVADKHDQAFTGFFISAAGLPAVEEEYKAVRKAAAGRYFKDGQATLSAFREQLDNGGILHLSTHASLEGDQQLPAIQLADGPFYLFEMYARKFRPGLIVLSACRTGQGMMAEGEGIISLAREFTTSGATGIVAGLWNLHDATAASLTGDFYGQLRNAADPAMALHHAKRQWLLNEKASQQLKLPYYWAAMTYIGHPQTIVPQKPSGNKMMWYLGLGIGALLLAAVGFFIRSRRKNAFHQAE